MHVLPASYDKSILQCVMNGLFITQLPAAAAFSLRCCLGFLGRRLR